MARLAHGLGKPCSPVRPRARRPMRSAPGGAPCAYRTGQRTLMFVPLVLAHRWTDVQLLGETAMGFVLLLAVTSTSYLINDLADLDADRRHATKRMRPVAAGEIPWSRWSLCQWSSCRSP